MSSLQTAFAKLEGINYLLGKANPSILTDDGFIQAVLREARLLQRATQRGLDSQAVRDSLKRNTEIDWKGSTEQEKDRALEQVTLLMAGLPSTIAPGVRVVLDQHGRRVFRDTSAALSRRHRQLEVNPSFALRNDRAVSALSESSSIFFKEEYERRASRFRRRSQDILARGTAEGQGTREIARALRTEFNDTAIAETYWETVAANHTNRARAFAALASYEEAGVSQYEVVAVMDERTTEVCRMMNGTILSVPSALDQLERLEAAEDLEEVKTQAAPFLRVDGDRIVTAAGQQIASRSGDAWSKATPSEMNASGIHAPPYHHRCRTTIVPVF